jgi:hypothetical protein
MPYQKKIWCPHPSHANLTRVGSKPSHPEARRLINELEAKAFNRQIISHSEWTSVVLKGGDKVCLRCFQSLLNILEAWFDSEKVNVESPDSENLGHTPFDEELEKISAKEELNAVFELFKMDKIRDE